MGGSHPVEKNCNVFAGLIQCGSCGSGYLVGKRINAERMVLPRLCIIAAQNAGDSLSEPKRQRREDRSVCD